MQVLLGILNVLKWIGIGLLSLLALVVVLLLIPVAVRLHYENGVFSVKLRVLFLNLSILPRREKPKKKKQKEKTEQPTEEEPTEKKKGLDIDFELIRALLPPAKSLLGRILRHIHIKNLRLRLFAHGADAAKVGINAGRMWAAVGALTPLLSSLFNITYKEVSVFPDFLDEHRGDEYFDCKIVAVPFILLIAGIAFLFRFMAIMSQKRARDDARAEEAHTKELERQETGTTVE